MPVIALHDAQSGSHARILPESGFNCFDFQAVVRGRPIQVIDAQHGFEIGKTRPNRSGIPILFPFPNRIRGGKFQWEGREYRLPDGDTQGNAIHGFVLDRPWRVTHTDERTAVGEFQLSVDAPERRPLWPADFVLEVRYSLRGPILRADIRIANPDQVPLPWGFGTHPYFRAPLAPESLPSDVLLQVPASEVWELSENLPTSRRLPVNRRTDFREGESAERQLDDVLTGVTSQGNQVETVLMDARAGLQVAQVADSVFREWVLFTPPLRQCLCVEPYTCVTDAINLQQQGIDAGLRVLGPGEEFRTWLQLRVSLVYA